MAFSSRLPRLLLRGPACFSTGRGSPVRASPTGRQTSPLLPEERPATPPPRVLRSAIPDIDIPRQPYVDFLYEGIDRVLDETSMVCGMSGRSYTYGDLRNYVTRVGSALTRRGFKKGDVFAIISPNIPEFVITFMGVASIGGIVTTANPLYTSEEIARQLNDCGAKFVMTIPHFSDMVTQAVANCPSVQECFIAGEADGFTPLIALAMDDGTAFPTNVSINPAEDILCLPYSSGTTGNPKGVMLTHQNVATNILQTSHEELLGSLSEDECMLTLLPLFHIYSMTTCMGLSLRGKFKMLTLPRFEPEMFLKALREYKPTIVPLVPPIISFLAKTPLMRQDDFDSVHSIVCGAAPLGHNVCEAFLAKIHPHKPSFIEGYGMTELSPVTHMTPRTAAKIGSCGVLVPNTEAKVIDLDTRENLGPMQPGELVVRGPQVMKGYFNNIKATEETIDSEGWLHTGDIVAYDEDGYFKIIDRLKGLIKVKGLQVAPSELEDLLLQHPQIQDVAVIGIPDSRSGELPRAYVVPKDASLSQEEVEAFLEGQVAPHKALKGGVEFVKTIPKTTTGKILHRELKQQYLKSQKSES